MGKIISRPQTLTSDLRAESAWISVIQPKLALRIDPLGSSLLAVASAWQRPRALGKACHLLLARGTTETYWRGLLSWALKISSSRQPGSSFCCPDDWLGTLPPLPPFAYGLENRHETK